MGHPKPSNTKTQLHINQQLIKTEEKDKRGLRKTGRGMNIRE